MIRELTPEERQAWAELAAAEQAMIAAQQHLIAITNKTSHRRLRHQRLHVIDGGRKETSGKGSHQAESVA